MSEHKLVLSKEVRDEMRLRWIARQSFQQIPLKDAPIYLHTKDCKKGLGGKAGKVVRRKLLWAAKRHNKDKVYIY